MDHSLDNAFDESVAARDIDFRHNIIFQEDEGDNMTFFEDKSDSPSSGAEEHNPNLGTPRHRHRPHPNPRQAVVVEEMED